jgi:hypothetical protein
MSNEAKLPLVYSCSGASSAAQMVDPEEAKRLLQQIVKDSWRGGYSPANEAIALQACGSEKNRAFLTAGLAKRNRGGNTRTQEPGVLLEGIQRLVTSGSRQILVNRRSKRS